MGAARAAPFLVPVFFSSGFLTRCLLRFGANEGIVHLRQRIDFRRLFAIVVGPGCVALGLVCLAQAIQVAGVLLVRLFKFRDRGVVVLFGEGDSASQFVGE